MSSHASSDPPSPKIDSALWSHLENGGTPNLLVSFGEKDYAAVLERVTQSIPPDVTDRGPRNEAILHGLSAIGAASQERAVRLLQERGVEFKQYLSTNKMIVRKGTAAIAQELAEDPQVKRIAEEPIVQLASASVNLK